MYGVFFPIYLFCLAVLVLRTTWCWRWLQEVVPSSPLSYHCMAHSLHQSPRSEVSHTTGCNSPQYNYEYTYKCTKKYLCTTARCDTLKPACFRKAFNFCWMSLNLDSDQSICMCVCVYIMCEGCSIIPMPPTSFLSLAVWIRGRGHANFSHVSDVWMIERILIVHEQRGSRGAWRAKVYTT